MNPAQQREYQTIEPRSSSRSEASAVAVLAEVAELTIATRFFLAVFALATSWPLLWGAYAIAGLDHWASWAVALGLLEPLGAMCLIGAVFFVAPSAPLSHLFAWASRRARFTLLGLYIGSIGAIVVGLIYAALKARGLT